MLQDLLSPHLGEKLDSADHASPAHSGRGADPTRPDPARGREEPDQHLIDIEDSANNTASMLQRFARVLKKRVGEADSFVPSNRGLGMRTVIHSQSNQ